MNISTARALVTGGGTGIGRATADLLIRRGAMVAICGRRADVLRATSEAIGAVPIEADVTDEADVMRMVDTVVGELGDYNVLVNNAGFGSFAPLLELEANDFRAVWETNVLGAMLVARESARHFVQSGGGNIVNIASTAGQRGFAGGSAYTASKFALSALTECWRAELRGSNVRVMQVNPSEVITDFYETAGREQHRNNPTKLHASDIARTIVAMLELDDRAFVTDTTIWATNPR